jgi:hypothetical protein
MHVEGPGGEEPENANPATLPAVSPTVPTSQASLTNVEPVAKMEIEAIKKGEYWLIGIGIVAILVNLVIAAIYFGQLKEMVKAAKASTDAAKAANDSVKVARDTLDANNRATLIDQRAWIGLSELKVVNTDTEQAEQQGFAINSGKTPARDVHAVMGVYAHYSPVGPYTPNAQDYEWIRYILKRAWNNQIKQTDYLYAHIEINPPYHGLLPPLSNFRDWVGAPQEKSMGVIPPGSSPYRLPLPHFAPIPTTFTLIFYGEIRYTDVTGKDKLSTQFCYIGPPGKAPVYPCEKLNDMK